MLNTIVNRAAELNYLDERERRSVLQALPDFILGEKNDFGAKN